MSASDAAKPQTKSGLGTFAGVFTPSVLTILGVIMFLRFGYVTGNAGLDRTLLIVLVANAVSILTSLSLAVIATNTRVQGGGDYFVISRSLGLEFGGAIGTVLYIAQSLSVGFYLVGFVEALADFLGGSVYFPAEIAGVALPEFLVSMGPDVAARSVATAACALLFIVTVVGADIATKLQFLIMATLVAALGSYVGGTWDLFDLELLAANRGPAPNGIPFWAVFAIFFPAITGFTQGVSMSGDLRDPARSLPKGTFWAVGVAMAVYLALPFLLAGSTERDLLLNDLGAGSMKRTSILPVLIDVGVFAATISSALASFMGAPRILQAMSRDRLFPGSKLFAKHRDSTGEPRVAACLTFVIALVCIWGGDLNAIAKIVTMFFLLSYGALNFGTFVEGVSRNPAFRPRFRLTSWRTALVGAVVCVSVMFAIEPLYTIVAVVVLIAITKYLESRKLECPAGDARRALYLQRIKDYLISLGKRTPHARDWRPMVIAVTKPGEDGRPLAQFAQIIGAGHGILTMAVVLVGSLKEKANERAKHIAELSRFVTTAGHRFFFEVPIAPSYSVGIRSLLMTHGIGSLRPNTLVLYWQNELEHEYLEILNDAALLRHNVVMLHTSSIASPFATDRAEIVAPGERRIDVWWRGRGNGSLALLLAHLIRETDEWRECEIRLLRIVTSVEEMEEAEHDLVELVKSSRIQAKVTIIHAKEAAFQVIADESEKSHLVFLGVGGVSDGARADLARYNGLLENMPTTTALVFTARELDVAI